MVVTPAKLQTLLEELRETSDWDLRAELLIEFADRFQEVPAAVAVRPFAETQRVPACESEAFVWALAEGASVRFYFAVENPQGISAMAMAVILDETLSGAPLAEIAAIDPSIVYDIFGRTISMGKGQGLMSMVNAVKAVAMQRLNAR